MTGAGDWSGFMSMYRFIVAGAVLWTWCWSSARSDFVAGAVSRDLDMWLDFRNRRKPRKLLFGMLILSLEVLLLRIALAGLRGVYLDVQISWQAQHFVDLEVQTLWQCTTLSTLKCAALCGP